uniref:Uncharacterized protein n=1 Tax=Sciurus vulgaris TaxID=55149 RepID=A0A8D2JFJ3_SCIVU
MDFGIAQKTLRYSLLSWKPSLSPCSWKPGALPPRAGGVRGWPSVSCHFEITLRSATLRYDLRSKNALLEEASPLWGPRAQPFSPRLLGTDWKLPTPLGPVHPPSASSGLSTAKATGQSWELSPPTAKSFPVHEVVHWPQQGPFWQFMDMKVEKRLAGRKERRSRFGEVNVHRHYPSGQVFSPFQALATMVTSVPKHEGTTCHQTHSHLHSVRWDPVRSFGSPMLILV